MRKAAVYLLLAALGAAAAHPGPALSAEGTATPAEAVVAAAPGPGPRLDVNRATLEELVAVPGIGPAIAGAILEARARRGAFTSLEDLLEVSGIGEKRLAELANHMEVLRPGSALATPRKN